MPDYLEPIIGWRMWVVEDRPLRQPAPGAIETIESAVLRHYSHEYPPDELVPRLVSHGRVVWPIDEALVAEHVGDHLYAATLLGNSHECNGTPCTNHSPGCGIYAFSSRERLMTELLPAWGEPLASRHFAIAVGTVAMWGVVAHHSVGYRSQFAYPASIEYTFHRDVGPQLAAVYGIPYKEAAVWTSVLRVVESSSSRSRSQSLGYAPMPWRPPNVMSLQGLVGMKVTVNKSSGVVAPIANSSASEKPERQSTTTLTQPSFNKHKPIRWLLRHGQWRRRTKDDER